jgi:hypothetical protein
METLFFLSANDIGLDDIGRLSEGHGFHSEQRKLAGLSPSLKISVPPDSIWEFSHMVEGDETWNELEPEALGVLRNLAVATVLLVTFRTHTLRRLLEFLAAIDPHGRIGLDIDMTLRIWEVSDAQGVMDHYRSLLE